MSDTVRPRARQGTVASFPLARPLLPLPKIGMTWIDDLTSPHTEMAACTTCNAHTRQAQQRGREFGWRRSAHTQREGLLIATEKACGFLGSDRLVAVPETLPACAFAAVPAERLAEGSAFLSLDQRPG